MVENASPNINYKNYNDNRINFYGFINDLIKISNITKKIIQNIFSYFKYHIIKLQNIVYNNPNNKGNKKILNDNNKRKEAQIKKRKNNVNNRNIINYLIRFIIINLICIIKSNIFDLFYFQYSKIILKIKGTGENMLFGKRGYKYFQSIDNLKSVYINGILKNEKDFKYDFSQENNIVELIWDDNIVNCSCMFAFCSNITEIDLSHFNTSQVKNMDRMFDHCSSLTSINLSNFNTLLVNDMRTMFSFCTSLTSIDLSNFNTSQVKCMSWMFEYCTSLTSIDLSNFDTSHVTSMEKMFSNCFSLISLNLSNFDTSVVQKMENMFCNCTSLVSLNLSNFNTAQVTNMKNMFDGCIVLEYINLNNFIENSSLYVTNMFNNIPDNTVICINESSTLNKIFPIINNPNKCYVIDCEDNWKSKQKKIINDTNECIESCDDSPKYIYEYNEKCYENCSNGFLDDENNNKMNKCKCELENCLECPNVALNKNLCTKCNINYFPKENDPLNIGEYINCYKDLEGYYLDNDIYKQCYYKCKICNESGNGLINNCIECKDNYEIKIIINNNYINCYENCSYYHYYDYENNHHCTSDSSCPNEYPFLDEDTKECLENLDKIILKDLIINEKSETIKMPESEEIIYYDNLLKIIEKGFTEYYDISKLDNGQDEIIKTEKMTVTFTTIENQKNNINSNMTRIDLGDCENLLKDDYNISRNETLYMKKIDIVEEGTKATKVEYDVYHNLFGKNLIKLNLTACENSKISIYMPYIINDNIDKFNSSSGYYNDICYTATSEDGTDITLKDRQTGFVHEDNVICQEGCDFSKYDFEAFIAKCSCDVKKSSSSFSDMKINKAKIVLENFRNIKNFANFNFLVCYKKLFNKEGIINNIGSYILIYIIIFKIITMLIFFMNQFSSIKNKIKDIMFGINENQIISKKRKRTNKQIKFRTKNSKKNKLNENSDIKKMITPKKNNKKVLNIRNKNKKSKKRNIAIIHINNNINNSNIFHNINQKFIKKAYTNNITTNLDHKRTRISSNIISKKKKIKNIMKYIDEEINMLPYNLALNHDKRSYCNYYTSLLRTKHILIFALFNNRDYNSSIIKMDLFFIEFSISYVVNALFYNDDTMHNIYKSKGEFDLEVQIPIIIYSSLISMILKTPLDSLALSNDAIITFKQNKSKINLMKRAEELKNKLAVKFILYFIISFLLLDFFWYYISMFGVIYKNTQIHLLKDTLMSFALSLLYPFGIYLFPGIFRIPALSNRKNKRECLYNFSKIIQLL